MNGPSQKLDVSGVLRVAHLGRSESTYPGFPPICSLAACCTAAVAESVDMVFASRTENKRQELFC